MELDLLNLNDEDFGALLGAASILSAGMVQGFYYAEGLDLFKTRIRCLPEAADGMKERARDGMRWIDGLLKGEWLAGVHDRRHLPLLLHRPTLRCWPAHPFRVQKSARMVQARRRPSDGRAQHLERAADGYARLGRRCPSLFGPEHPPVLGGRATYPGRPLANDEGDESGPIKHRMPLSSLGGRQRVSGGDRSRWPAQARTPQGTAHAETLCSNETTQDKSIAVAAASQSSRSARTTSAFVRRKA